MLNGMDGKKWNQRKGNNMNTRTTLTMAEHNGVKYLFSKEEILREFTQDEVNELSEKVWGFLLNSKEIDVFKDNPMWIVKQLDLEEFTNVPYLAMEEIRFLNGLLYEIVSCQSEIEEDETVE